jgi:hypothetical protein
MHPMKTKSALSLAIFRHRCPLVVQRLVMLWACGLLSIVVPIHSWAGGL